MKFKVETVKWAWPSGRNGFGFFVYLKMLLSLEGAASNEVLLPLWLCEGNTAHALKIPNNSKKVIAWRAIALEIGSSGDFLHLYCSAAVPGPQGRLILPQSTSAQRPSLVLQLFKLAVDGGPSFHAAQK
ncbi:unnamed protein product [Boreogadus saida]